MYAIMPTFVNILSDAGVIGSFSSDLSIVPFFSVLVIFHSMPSFPLPISLSRLSLYEGTTSRMVCIMHNADGRRRREGGQIQ